MIDAVFIKDPPVCFGNCDCNLHRTARNSRDNSVGSIDCNTSNPFWVFANEGVVMKNILKSKTFWLNLASMVVTMVSPDVQSIIQSHPAVATGIATGANIALRLATSQSVSILPQ